LNLGMEIQRDIFFCIGSPIVCVCVRADSWWAPRVTSRRSALAPCPLSNTHTEANILRHYKEMHYHMRNYNLNEIKAGI
jgi:hypothetical protein